MRKLAISLIVQGLLAFGTAGARADAGKLSFPNNLAPGAESKYWTPERLKRAVPMPLPQLSKEEFERRFGAGAAKGSQAAPTTIGQPTEANINERPFWNGGVLFFTTDSGQDSQCTAEFTGTKHVLLAAAHCVQNGHTGKFYRNFVFYRAYHGRILGLFPTGQLVGINCAGVKTQWAGENNNYAFDYAFLHTHDASGAGWLGLRTDHPNQHYDHWWSIGYPKNHGDNNRMYKVYGVDDGLIRPGVIRMGGNPFNQGASGGAWIAELTIPHVGGNYAIGVNSFISDAAPGSVFGPVFDAATHNLFEYTERGCKDAG